MSSDSLDALRKRNLELETANQSKELDIQMLKNVLDSTLHASSVQVEELKTLRSETVSLQGTIDALRDDAKQHESELRQTRQRCRELEEQLVSGEHGLEQTSVRLRQECERFTTALNACKWPEAPAALQDMLTHITERVINSLQPFGKTLVAVQAAQTEEALRELIRTALVESLTPMSERIEAMERHGEVVQDTLNQMMKVRATEVHAILDQIDSRGRSDQASHASHIESASTSLKQQMQQMSTSVMRSDEDICRLIRETMEPVVRNTELLLTRMPLCRDDAQDAMFLLSNDITDDNDGADTLTRVTQRLPFRIWATKVDEFQLSMQQKVTESFNALKSGLETDGAQCGVLRENLCASLDGLRARLMAALNQVLNNANLQSGKSSYRQLVAACQALCVMFTQQFSDARQQLYEQVLTYEQLKGQTLESTHASLSQGLRFTIDQLSCDVMTDVLTPAASTRPRAPSPRPGSVSDPFPDTSHLTEGQGRLEVALQEHHGACSQSLAHIATLGKTQADALIAAVRLIEEVQVMCRSIQSGMETSSQQYLTYANRLGATADLHQQLFALLHQVLQHLT